MQDSITHEALEAVRKVEATVEQGGWRALLVMHGEQVVATYSNLYETHAPSPENHLEADAFIAGWKAALRTGQLILAQPSGDVVGAVARAINLTRFEDDGSSPCEDDYDMARAAITAYEAVSGVAKMREALRPFAFIGEDDPKDTQAVWEMIYSDRVQDWFSYEDFERARDVLAALKEACRG